MAEPAGQAGAVQRHLADALARRAATQSGVVRQLIEARVAALQRDLAALDAASAARPVRHPPAPGPLADLVAALGPGTGSAAELPDLKTVDYFRSTWTQLGAERRLAQTQAALPDNAGPLNSQLLVHRALVLMREASPVYLQHFMAHVGALAWLDEAASQPGPAPSAKARTAAAGPKTGRATGRKGRGR